MLDRPARSLGPDARPSFARLDTGARVRSFVAASIRTLRAEVVTRHGGIERSKTIEMTAEGMLRTTTDNGRGRSIVSVYDAARGIMSNGRVGRPAGGTAALDGCRLLRSRPGSLRRSRTAGPPCPRVARVRRGRHDRRWTGRLDRPVVTAARKQPRLRGGHDRQSNGVGLRADASSRTSRSTRSRLSAWKSTATSPSQPPRRSSREDRALDTPARRSRRRPAWPGTGPSSPTGCRPGSGRPRWRSLGS